MLPHQDTVTLSDGPPLGEAAAAAILIHGRGASAESILDLGRAFQLDELTWIAPQAQGHTWYPHSFLAPLAHNEPYLSGALARIDGLIQLILDAGVSADRIALVGFSQGACLALEYAARAASPPGAVVALSGGLIGRVDIHGSAPPFDKGFDYDTDLQGCRVFLGCSDIDAHIPLDRVTKTGEIFRGLGAETDVRVYPGMGHTVNADEIQAGRLILGAMAGITPA